MSKKYIYIFTNTHSEGIVKIGRTDKYPEIRAEQLNRQTGTIGKYEVAWFREVPDNVIAEQIIHYALKELNFEKEYFYTDKQYAEVVCEKILDSYFGLVEDLREKRKNHLVTLIEGLYIALEFKDIDSKHSTKELIKKLESELTRLDTPSV